MATLESDPDKFSDAQLAGMNISRAGLQAWNDYSRELEAGAPPVGTLAPDFHLPELIGGRLSPSRLALSTLRDRPVGLLFGSITCPIYRGQIPHYNAIFEELGAQLHIVGVYVREAHPVDGWSLPHNATPETQVLQPTSLEARAGVAARAVAAAGIRYRLLVDDLDDAVMTRYAAAPERLYALDRDGIVRFRSSVGPFDDDDVQAWHEALSRLARDQR